MLTGNLSYSAYQGQDWCDTLYVVDNNNVPVDFSYYDSFSGIIKFKYGSSGVLGYINCNIPSNSTGYLHLTIPATGTASFPATWGVYSVRAYLSGEFMEEYARGYFYIHPDVFSLS